MQESERKEPGRGGWLLVLGLEGGQTSFHYAMGAGVDMGWVDDLLRIWEHMGSRGDLERRTSHMDSERCPGSRSRRMEMASPLA